MAYAAPDEALPGPDVNKPVQSGQAPVASGGAGVSASGKAAATPGQNIPAKPSAQLSDYLAANQPQAAAFAGNIANTLANQTSAAGAGITPAVNTYTGNLYTVPTNADVNSAVESSPSSLTPEQQATYKTELGANAAAPNSANTFETTPQYQSATQGIQNAVEQANLWNSGNNVSSLSTALAPFEGGNATSGGKTLDALLLSQSPDAYSKIQSAVAPASKLSGELTAATTTADEALKNAIAQDAATSSAANQSAGKFVTGLNTTLAGYLANAQKQADAYNAEVNSLAGQEQAVQPKVSKLQDAIAAYNAMIKNSGTGNMGNPDLFTGLAPIGVANVGGIPSTVGLPPVSSLGTAQNYLDIAALENLLGAGNVAGFNPSITSATANEAGTYTPPNMSVPTLGGILSPLETAAQQGIGANSKIIGSNPVLSQNAVTSPYNEVLAAYDALTGQTSAVAPTGPTPPPGIVPGTPEYNTWLQQQYPGLNIPPPGSIGTL